MNPKEIARRTGTTLNKVSETIAYHHHSVALRTVLLWLLSGTMGLLLFFIQQNYSDWKNKIDMVPGLSIRVAAMQDRINVMATNSFTDREAEQLEDRIGRMEARIDARLNRIEDRVDTLQWN